ncbi:MAG: hypothetical protein R3A12_17530 [Ignavibacteria bacterium]
MEKPEYEETGGIVNGKKFTRKVTILDRAQFEKTLTDLRLALKIQQEVNLISELF